MVNVWFIFVLVFVICLLWLVNFLYSMWTPVMANVAPTMETFLNDSETQTGISSQPGRNAIQDVRWVYISAPIILLVGIFIWLFLATQKTEPMYVGI